MWDTVTPLSIQQVFIGRLFCACPVPGAGGSSGEQDRCGPSPWSILQSHPCGRGFRGLGVESREAIPGDGTDRLQGLPEGLMVGRKVGLHPPATQSCLQLHPSDAGCVATGEHPWNLFSPGIGTHSTTPSPFLSGPRCSIFLPLINSAFSLICYISAAKALSRHISNPPLSSWPGRGACTSNNNTCHCSRGSREPHSEHKIQTSRWLPYQASSSPPLLSCWNSGSRQLPRDSTLYFCLTELIFFLSYSLKVLFLAQLLELLR